MRFTSEQRLNRGVVEREFTLGEIPGILWTPGSASVPAPVILLGHPGGLDAMYPRLAARARHAAADGFAAATIELPGSGDRPRLAAVEQARTDLRKSLTAGEPVNDIVDRLVLPPALGSRRHRFESGRPDRRWDASTRPSCLLPLSRGGLKDVTIRVPNWTYRWTVRTVIVGHQRR
jgi:hypothetical protein